MSNRYAVAVSFALAVAVVAGCTSPASTTSEVTAEVLGSSIVLDVRSAAEHADGHLKGDHNIAVGDLSGRLAEVSTLVGNDKSARIVTYCRSGNRSAKAKDILTAAGFTNVVNAGGYGDIVARFPSANAR